MTVELHLATALLLDLDPARNPLPGREVARRPSPVDPMVTIVELETTDAPEGAALVDPIFRRAGFHDIRITEIRWYDRDGYFIAPGRAAATTEAGARPAASTPRSLPLAA
ncbi:hypothetical protein [Streptomyces hundungensis]|uniref:hypothetical protein n=1 Tax=Streptomyces hundungensis TaxID=1077946 RepID=UPI0033F123F4